MGAPLDGVPTYHQHNGLVDSEQDRKKRLRAALDGVQLNPEQTKDDTTPAAENANEAAQRDREFDANRPPHHAG